MVGVFREHSKGFFKDGREFEIVDFRNFAFSDKAIYEIFKAFNDYFEKQWSMTKKQIRKEIFKK